MGNNPRGWRTRFISALFVLVVGANGSTQSRSEAGPDLRGFWEHGTCQVVERDGQRTSSRSLFTIFEREWGIAFTQFVDADCKIPAMTAVLQGTYHATGPSTSVPGATEVTFRFTRKAITPHDPALLSRLNGGACGERSWTRGVEHDVSATGCLGIQSVADCGQEYDLAQIVDNRLFLGERPAPGQNICADDRRPRRVRAEPLQRR